jgi:hypothetical protein
MNRRDFWILAIGWLTGGLAGAVVSFIMNSTKGWWLRPRIEFLFDNAEPGCRIDTNFLGGTEIVLRFVIGAR